MSATSPALLKPGAILTFLERLRGQLQPLMAHLHDGTPTESRKTEKGWPGSGSTHLQHHLSLALFPSPSAPRHNLYTKSTQNTENEAMLVGAGPPHNKKLGHNLWGTDEPLAPERGGSVSSVVFFETLDE